jgi:cysteine desulfurase
VNSDGTLDPHLVEAAINNETALVSVMWANNETGVLLPVPEIADICVAKGVMFHTDAVQMAGKLPLDLKTVPVNFLSLSMHKLHAPRGAGVLFVRKHTRFSPFIRGGNQENGKRAGTENVAAIVAAGKAAELAKQRLGEENTRVRALRDRLEDFILKNIAGTTINGHRQKRLPNTTNISFEGIDAAGLLVLMNQKNICASSGSACTTGKIEPSRILTAMGISPSQARASIRFSLGLYNKEDDIAAVESLLPRMVDKLRSANPLTAEIAALKPK